MNEITSQLNKLTPREEQGFLFESEISELLFSIGLDHDEFPHLFREDFKQNISKGVDFRIEMSVDGRTIKTCIECKDWNIAYPSWLYHITNRFQGQTNYGDYNICVTRKLYSNNFYRYKDTLKEHGITLLADYELVPFLLKIMSKGTKCTSLNSVLLSDLGSMLCSTLNIMLKQPYTKQFHDEITNSTDMLSFEVSNFFLPFINRYRYSSTTLDVGTYLSLLTYFFRSIG